MLDGLSPKRDSHVFALTLLLEVMMDANRQKPKLAEALKVVLLRSFIWN